MRQKGLSSLCMDVSKQKSRIMPQLVGTRNEDTRYDFLWFIGSVTPSYLSDLSHGFMPRNLRPYTATVRYAVFTFCFLPVTELHRVWYLRKDTALTAQATLHPYACVSHISGMVFHRDALNVSASC